MGFFDSQAAAVQTDFSAFVSVAEQKVSADAAALAQLQGQLDSTSQQLKAAQAQILADQAEEANESSQPKTPQLKLLARFADVHLRSDWKIVTGSNIGGSAPQVFTFTHLADPAPDASCVPGTVLKVSISGSAYKDGLGSVHIPYVFAAGKFRIRHHVRFRYTGGELQAHEFDTKHVDKDGNIYDGSLQNAYYLGGILQMWKGGWFDGPKVGIPAANVKHEMSIEYELDTMAQTIRYISFTQDGTFFDLSATSANSAKASNWTPGIDPQHQLDTPGSGATADFFIDQEEYLVFQVSN